MRSPIRLASRPSVAALIAILCATLSHGTAYAQSPTAQWPPAGVKEIPAQGSPISVSVAIFMTNLNELDELASNLL